ERAGFRVVGMRSLLVHAEVDLLAHGAHGVLLRISLRTPLLPAQGGDRHGLDGRADDVLLGGVVAEAVLLGAVIDLLLQAGDVTEGVMEGGVSGGLVDGRCGVGHGSLLRVIEGLLSVLAVAQSSGTSTMVPSGLMHM